MNVFCKDLVILGFSFSARVNRCLCLQNRAESQKVEQCASSLSRRRNPAMPPAPFWQTKLHTNKNLTFFQSLLHYLSGRALEIAKMSLQKLTGCRCRFKFPPIQNLLRVNDRQWRKIRHDINKNKIKKCTLYSIPQIGSNCLDTR